MKLKSDDDLGSEGKLSRDRPRTTIKGCQQPKMTAYLVRRNDKLRGHNGQIVVVNGSIDGQSFFDADLVAFPLDEVVVLITRREVADVFSG